MFLNGNFKKLLNTHKKVKVLSNIQELILSGESNTVIKCEKTVIEKTDKNRNTKSIYLFHTHNFLTVCSKEFANEKKIEHVSQLLVGKRAASIMCWQIVNCKNMNKSALNE